MKNFSRKITAHQEFWNLEFQQPHLFLEISSHCTSFDVLQRCRDSPAPVITMMFLHFPEWIALTMPWTESSSKTASFFNISSSFLLWSEVPNCPNIWDKSSTAITVRFEIWIRKTAGNVLIESSSESLDASDFPGKVRENSEKYLENSSKIRITYHCSRQHRLQS